MDGTILNIPIHLIKIIKTECIAKLYMTKQYSNMFSSLSAMPMLMPLTVTGENWKTANVMK